jgi:hypothetical protein
MTVAELIELLKTFPQDAPIAYTYESVVDVFGKDEIYLSKDGVVIIGSEYREEFESGKWSARKSGGLKPDEG